MKIIEINHSPYEVKGFCATIGIFEGVHLAHQELINKCLEIAEDKKLASCIITFNLQTSLDKVTNKIPLFDEEDKILRLSSSGVDRLIVIDFDEDFKKISHQDFMQMLVDQSIKHLVLGFDFTYGFECLGNVNTIRRDSKRKITTTIMPKKTIGEQKIGTTQIKEYLSQGKIEEANRLLGFPYYIKLSGGHAPQLALLKDGSYLVLSTKDKQMVTIKDGKLIDFDNPNNITLTFFKNQE